MADTGVAAVARRVRVRDRGVCLRTNWLAVGLSTQRETHRCFPNMTNRTEY